MEVYTPPLANPAPGGLYSAATVIDRADDESPRLAGGITVDSWNCGPSWVWPIVCIAEEDTPDPSPKGAEPRSDNLEFGGEEDGADYGGVTVGADDNCSALVPEDVARQRAEQLLRLQEPVKVEKELVDALLGMAGAPTDAAGLVAAVGKLEEIVAEYGFTGVLHAAPHLVAALHNAHLVLTVGGKPVSPRGHRWAFGAGYTELGETIVATGPVVVHRNPVEVRHGPDYPKNQRLSIAERAVLVTWECYTAAVTIGD